MVCTILLLAGIVGLALRLVRWATFCVPDKAAEPARPAAEQPVTPDIGKLA
jgi:hypothetical protein